MFTEQDIVDAVSDGVLFAGFLVRDLTGRPQIVSPFPAVRVIAITSAFHRGGQIEVTVDVEETASGAYDVDVYFEVNGRDIGVRHETDVDEDDVLSVVTGLIENRLSAVADPVAPRGPPPPTDFLREIAAGVRRALAAAGVATHTPSARYLQSGSNEYFAAFGPTPGRPPGVEVRVASAGVLSRAAGPPDAWHGLAIYLPTCCDDVRFALDDPRDAALAVQVAVERALRYAAGQTGPVSQGQSGGGSGSTGGGSSGPVEWDW